MTRRVERPFSWRLSGGVWRLTGALWQLPHSRARHGNCQECTQSLSCTDS
jgi:hypothetical protein